MEEMGVSKKPHSVLGVLLWPESIKVHLVTCKAVAEQSPEVVGLEGAWRVDRLALLMSASVRRELNRRSISGILLQEAGV